MKRALALTLLMIPLCGCDEAINKAMSPGGTPKPQPGQEVVVKKATPTPAPKEGDWMWKSYKNPLDASRDKNQKKRH